MALAGGSRAGREKAGSKVTRHDGSRTGGSQAGRKKAAGCEVTRHDGSQTGVS